ncbi:MAG: nicotinate-nucleotide--dimethylbenzimidazole phosphoribosyltransferase [Myxococcota bacterium]|nr:nicotinate-nucleotide--dimethylbenzimidazole phosphoribosyltransferase [Myxococcota bacterium]
MPFHTESAAECASHIDTLAKPPGSLGDLERLAIRLAGCQGSARPTCVHPRVIVFAGDHGVTVESVSPYPSAVTVAMVRTFAAGKAAVSALARVADADLEVVDVGVIGLGPVTAGPGVRVVSANVRAGTRNLAETAAMTTKERDAALDAGRAAVDRAAADGVDVLALGEMGIGNSTPAAALTAALCGLDAAAATGPGTGLDADGVKHKSEVIARALARGGPRDPLGALADLGGLEIAALTGAMHRAAEVGIPVFVDGFICSAAARVAVGAWPSTTPFLIPATRSTEPGQAALLEALEGPPLLDLRLRLGEASGAALALPLARAACAIPSEMATLAEVLAGAS